MKSYVDASGREWVKGCPSKRERDTLIVLPIQMDSMYPLRVVDTTDDYLFCQCAVCGAFVQGGLVAIYLGVYNWGVRIVCVEHSQTASAFTTTTLITEVGSLLTNRISEACRRCDVVCASCGKPKCVRDECAAAEELIFPSRKEKLLSHFYRERLNLITPLLNLCFACTGPTGSRKFSCETCGAVFCCKRCKKKNPHECTPLESVFVV